MQLAQAYFVKFPSMTGVVRRWPVVDQLRKVDAHKWAQTLGALSAAGIIIGQIMFGAGGMFANNSATAQAVTEIKAQLNGLVTVQDANRLKEQITGLTSLVGQLQTDLRAVPRADQIIVLDRHLSAQDGRMDSMDSRLRDIENRTAALQARVGLIEQSSSAPLGHK